MTQMTTEEDTRVVLDQDPFETPYTEDADPGHRTHMINPAANVELQAKFWRMDAGEIVKTARFFRMEIVALCGYRFIPERNPEKYDTCEPCAKIAGQIMSEDG